MVSEEQVRKVVEWGRDHGLGMKSIEDYQKAKAMMPLESPYSDPMEFAANPLAATLSEEAQELARENAKRLAMVEANALAKAQENLDMAISEENPNGVVGTPSQEDKLLYLQKMAKAQGLTFETEREAQEFVRRTLSPQSGEVHEDPWFNSAVDIATGATGAILAKGGLSAAKAMGQTSYQLVQQQLAEELASEIGAAAGMATARYVAPDNIIAELASGLLGGFTGGGLHQVYKDPKAAKKFFDERVKRGVRKTYDGVVGTKDAVADAVSRGKESVSDLVGRFDPRPEVKDEAFKSLVDEARDRLSPHVEIINAQNAHMLAKQKSKENPLKMYQTPDGAVYRDGELVASSAEITRSISNTEVAPEVPPKGHGLGNRTNDTNPTPETTTEALSALNKETPPVASVEAAQPNGEVPSTSTALVPVGQTPSSSTALVPVGQAVRQAPDSSTALVPVRQGPGTSTALVPVRQASGGWSLELLPSSEAENQDALDMVSDFLRNSTPETNYPALPAPAPTQPTTAAVGKPSEPASVIVGYPPKPASVIVGYPPKSAPAAASEPPKPAPAVVRKPPEPVPATDEPVPAGKMPDIPLADTFTSVGPDGVKIIKTVNRRPQRPGTRLPSYAKVPYDRSKAGLVRASLRRVMDKLRINSAVEFLSEIKGNDGSWKPFFDQTKGESVFEKVLSELSVESRMPKSELRSMLYGLASDPINEHSIVNPKTGEVTIGTAVDKYTFREGLDPNRVRHPEKFARDGWEVGLLGEMDRNRAPTRSIFDETGATGRVELDPFDISQPTKKSFVTLRNGEKVPIVESEIPVANNSKSESRVSERLNRAVEVAEEENVHPFDKKPYERPTADGIELDTPDVSMNHHQADTVAPDAVARYMEFKGASGKDLPDDEIEELVKFSKEWDAKANGAPEDAVAREWFTGGYGKVDDVSYAPQVMKNEAELFPGEYEAAIDAISKKLDMPRNLTEFLLDKASEKGSHLDSLLDLARRSDIVGDRKLQAAAFDKAGKTAAYRKIFRAHIAAGVDVDPDIVSKCRFNDKTKRQMLADLEANKIKRAKLEEGSEVWERYLAGKAYSGKRLREGAHSLPRKGAPYFDETGKPVPEDQLPPGVTPLRVINKRSFDVAVNQLRGEYAHRKYDELFKKLNSLSEDQRNSFIDGYLERYVRSKNSKKLSKKVAGMTGDERMDFAKKIFGRDLKAGRIPLDESKVDEFIRNAVKLREDVGELEAILEQHYVDGMHPFATTEGSAALSLYDRYPDKPRNGGRGKTGIFHSRFVAKNRSNKMAYETIQSLDHDLGEAYRSLNDLENAQYVNRTLDTGKKRPPVEEMDKNDAVWAEESLDPEEDAIENLSTEDFQARIDAIDESITTNSEKALADNGGRAPSVEPKREMVDAGESAMEIARGTAPSPAEDLTAAIHKYADYLAPKKSSKETPVLTDKHVFEIAEYIPPKQRESLLKIYKSPKSVSPNERLDTLSAFWRLSKDVLHEMGGGKGKLPSERRSLGILGGGFSSPAVGKAVPFVNAFTRWFLDPKAGISAKALARTSDIHHGIDLIKRFGSGEIERLSKQFDNNTLKKVLHYASLPTGEKALTKLNVSKQTRENLSKLQDMIAPYLQVEFGSSDLSHLMDRGYFLGTKHRVKVSHNASLEFIEGMVKGGYVTGTSLENSVNKAADLFTRLTSGGPRSSDFRKALGDLERILGTSLEDAPQFVKSILGDVTDPQTILSSNLSHVVDDVAQKRMVSQIFDLYKDGDRSVLSGKKIVGYRQIPDNVPEIGGMYAPKYIADRVSSNYRELGKLARLGGHVQTIFKKGKVFYNAGAYGRNFISNILLSEIGGVPLHYQAKTLPGVVKDLRAFSKTGKMAPWLEEAMKEGVLRGTMTTGDLNMLKKSLSVYDGVGEGGFEGMLEAVNRFMSSNKIGSAGEGAYEFIEDISRLTAYKYYVENGIPQGLTKKVNRGEVFLPGNTKATPKEAVEEVNKWLFDYSEVPEFVDAMRKSAVPFITFPYYATKAMGRAVKDGNVGLLSAFALVKGLQTAIESATGEHLNVDSIFPMWSVFTDGDDQRYGKSTSSKLTGAPNRAGELMDNFLPGGPATLPLEVAGNYSLFKGREIGDGKDKAKHVAETLLPKTPMSIAKYLSGDRELSIRNILSDLGISFSKNTRDRVEWQYGTRIKDEIQAYRRFKERNKDRPDLVEKRKEKAEKRIKKFREKIVATKVKTG